MAGGVSAYAAINARVRILFSTLLSASQLAALGDAPDLASLSDQLKLTSYAADLEVVKASDLTSRDLESALKKRVAAVYQSVIHSAPGDSRGILIQLYRRYEVSNLKAVLRAIATGLSTNGVRRSWEEVRELMFPYGPGTVLPQEQMMGAGSIAGAVELLRASPYYDVLLFALRRYNAEQSLFPLEVALDLHYWGRLWQATAKLAVSDRGPARRVVGSLLDLNNLMWAIRYRVYQALSEEELINYTLPFGYRVHDDDIRSIAAGADIGAVIRRLYPGSSEAAALLEDPRKDLPILELQLKRQVMKDCMATFLGNPFHIGLPLAYLVLQDLEVQDLTVLIEGKASRLAAERIRPFVLRSLATAA